MLDTLVHIPACRRHLEFRLAHRAQAESHLQNPMLSFVPPGHFYSPLPDLNEILADRERMYREAEIEDGLSLSLEAQLHLAEVFGRYQAGFPWTEQQTSRLRYRLRNDFFPPGDACSLYSMIRHFTPKRIIEVGSGYSSAVMLDTIELYATGKVDVCFIEPFPDRLESLLRETDHDRVRIIRTPVQQVPDSVFEPLEENDILFIDSSHVSKAGSDVNRLLFSVLPRLSKGTLVHIHDIFYPFEYPLDWFKEGRCWNELYLVRAFMLFNSGFETIFFNSYLWSKASESVARHLPPFAAGAGGSLWLRRL